MKCFIYEVVGSGRNVPNLVVLIEIIIWDAVLIWLNDGVSLPMPFVSLSPVLVHFLPDPTTS